MKLCEDVLTHYFLGLAVVLTAGEGKIKNAIDGEIEVTLAVSHNVSKLKAIFSHFMTVT